MKFVKKFTWPDIWAKNFTHEKRIISNILYKFRFKWFWILLKNENVNFFWYKVCVNVPHIWVNFKSICKFCVETEIYTARKKIYTTNFKSVANIKYQRPTISSRCSLTAHQRAEWPSPVEMVKDTKTLKYTETLNHEIWLNSYATFQTVTVLCLVIQHSAIRNMK